MCGITRCIDIHCRCFKIWQDTNSSSLFIGNCIFDTEKHVEIIIEYLNFNHMDRCLRHIFKKKLTWSFKERRSTEKLSSCENLFVIEMTIPLIKPWFVSSVFINLSFFKCIFSATSLSLSLSGTGGQLFCINVPYTSHASIAPVYGPAIGTQNQL